MKYKIKVDYSTGDSFKHYDTSSYLELEFDNLDIAKENLARIKAHYTMYKELNGYNYSWDNKKTKSEIFDHYKRENWFVNTLNRRGEIDDMAQYCINLIADNGNTMQMSCFWCGYFETLNGAEIEIDNSDMKFTI